MNKYKRFLEGDKRARKVANIYKSLWGYAWDDDTYEEMVKHLRSTRVPCSCSMCGSVRKHFGEVTLQEIKSQLDFVDGIDDIRS